MTVENRIEISAIVAPEDARLCVSLVGYAPQQSNRQIRELLKHHQAGFDGEILCSIGEHYFELDFLTPTQVKELYGGTEETIARRAQ